MTGPTWEQSLARITAGEPVEDVLDEQHAADRAHLRSVLADMGKRGIEAMAQYDEAMRNLDLGITRARMLWHSISEAQRRAVVILCESGGRAVRRDDGPGIISGIYTLPDSRTPLCRVSTLRMLCRHDLLAWDGGAFDPEAAAVLTERGTFTMRHGRPTGATP
jgi:hypothetical protein